MTRYYLDGNEEGPLEWYENKEDGLYHLLEQEEHINFVCGLKATTPMDDIGFDWLFVQSVPAFLCRQCRRVKEAGIYLPELPLDVAIDTLKQIEDHKKWEGTQAEKEKERQIRRMHQSYRRQVEDRKAIDSNVTALDKDKIGANLDTLIWYYKPAGMAWPEAHRLVLLYGIEHLKELKRQEQIREHEEVKQAQERINNSKPPHTGASHRSCDLWKDHWNRTHRRR